MKRTYLILLGLIIAVSLFFRTYQLSSRLGFDHDGDLSAWIVKDIAVNHHLRLIGQLTSAPGIFIGGLYYYLLVPFYSLTGMDPLGGAVLVTIIGVLSTLSYFVVFSKLFNIQTGLIAAFLQSSLLSWVSFDRQAVPSTPSNLWVVWYFYTLLRIAQGNFSVLPLLGILIGLIWHIHIALLPSLIAIPVAFYVSKKLPTLKQTLSGLLLLLITSLPLLLFEIRHNFSQTISLFNNFTSAHGQATGLTKAAIVLNMVSKNINTLFLSPMSLPHFASYFFSLILLLTGALLVIKKIIPTKVSLPLFSWLAGVVIFFGFSSSPVSEYYLYGIEIIFVAIVSIALSKIPKTFLLALLGVLLIKNIFYFINADIYHKGYAERKATAAFITEDAKLKGYPCIGVSYITTPGENVGFRYFFYLNKLHLVHPSLDVPVYNIVIPDELSNEDKIKFGHIGVISPATIPSKEITEKSCQTPDTNLTDSMFGYVQ